MPLFLCLLVLALPTASAQDSTDAPPRSTVADSEATASGALGEYANAYFQLDALNAGLGGDGAANLQTPQAALEHFVLAGRGEDWLRAAQALNLNLLPEAEQARRAPELAEQLFYVLDKQLGFDWEGLTDRADGASTQPSPGGNGLLGQPRRSLALGTLELDGRDAAVRLQRVKAGDAAPVWVVSPQTVENVPALYRQYGPGPVDRLMPEWARTQVLGQTALWAWLALLAGLVGAVFFAWWARRVTKRWTEDADSHWTRGLGDEIATPVALCVAFLLLYLLASAVLALPVLVTTLLLVALIGSFVWLAMRTISCLTEQLTVEQDVDDLADLSGNERTEQQRWLTYLSVGRRVLLFIVFLLGAGIVLSQFEGLQAVGFSLAASAGVATVLLGIAAQPVLGNIVASMQIALAKPVRIGDSVLFKGEWGYVEDITYTYVLIRTWDQRRVIVPLRYFVTHPFENWTIRDAHLVKPIYLRADYTLDVDAFRATFAELLRQKEDWDEQNEPTVQVTDVDDETIEVRALCSAKDPGTAWDLHCELREELVAYLRDLDGGRYLPRRRVALDGRGETERNGQAGAGRSA